MPQPFKIEFSEEEKLSLYAKGEGKTCRLCLCDGANHNIFDGDLLTIHKIQRYCEVQILENDGFPDHICTNCHSTLDIAETFKNQCLESDRILRSNALSSDIKCSVKEECSSNDGFNNNYEDFEAFDDFEDIKNIKKIKVKSIKEHSQTGRKSKRKLAKIVVNEEVTEELKLELEEEENLDETPLKKRHRVLSKSTLCPSCGKTFTKLASLNAHIKTHRTDRPFTCDICSKTFFEKWHMHEHKKTHTDVKSYPCEACGKLFKTPRDTRRHMDAVHNKKRAVQCKLCTKYLSSNSGLKLHMKSHTGEKEFQCEVCSRKFISKPCLTLHMRVHTGEKPYACKFCDGKFAILKTLKEHERIHTGETPYRCPVCKKGFSQKSNMKSHVRYNHRGVEHLMEQKSLVLDKDEDVKDKIFIERPNLIMPIDLVRVNNSAMQILPPAFQGYASRLMTEEN